VGLWQRIKSLFRRRERVAIMQLGPSFVSISQSERPARPKALGAKEPDAGSRVWSGGLAYVPSYGGQPQWLLPQYNHHEIEAVYDTESYFARATRAKLNLFTREGFEFVGQNDERVEYIRLRIQQIERASLLPFEVLLLQTCRDLAVHANAYWLKVRKLDASGGQRRTVGRVKIDPVAGYFPLPPEAMVPKVDEAGNIVAWKLVVGGIEKIYQTRDIVHFYAHRKGGYPLGVPSVHSAIDDIRMLRDIEANIEILIHKHLFPIILWKVGTESNPARAYEDGTDEISVLRQEVMEMPQEGSFFVNERVGVSAVGLEGKALQVQEYLQYFRERVLAGLDISAIDVGIGSSASRSTAQTLSRNLIDAVKYLQILVERFADAVIEELLLESTFPTSGLLDGDNAVRLRFHEVDKEAKIARENHAVDVFLKNAITFSELRAEFRREPLTEEEEKGLYWNKFGKPMALIAAVDEPYTEEAKASVANKNAPSNQYGARPAAKLNKDTAPREDRSTNPILRWHLLWGEELQGRWLRGELDYKALASEAILNYGLAKDEFGKLLARVVRGNYFEPLRIGHLVEFVQRRAESSIDRLRRDVVDRLGNDRESSPFAIFLSLAYRAELIYDTELAFAGNLSRFKWLQGQKKSAVAVSRPGVTPCNLCLSRLTIIRWDDTLGETMIPPHHPLCGCVVEEARELR
jgi:hypothetical protein